MCAQWSVLEFVFVDASRQRMRHALGGSLRVKQRGAEWQLRGTGAETFGLIDEFLGYLADLQPPNDGVTVADAPPHRDRTRRRTPTGARWSGAHAAAAVEVTLL